MIEYNILFILHKPIFIRLLRRSVFQRKKGRFEGIKIHIFREKGVILGTESQRKGTVLGIEEH